MLSFGVANILAGRQLTHDLLRQFSCGVCNTEDNCMCGNDVVFSFCFLATKQ
jgi:hypothetical protein